MIRPKVEKVEIRCAEGEIEDWLSFRIKQKGRGAFISLHEIRGMMDEEFEELKDALHEKNTDKIVHELKDVIAGGIFALACIRGGHIE